MNSAWKPVPTEATAELLADTTKGKQVLAYENGRYYNAWLEFEQSEGGWLWTDDGDSEPNPSHYMPLPADPEAGGPANPLITEKMIEVLREIEHAESVEIARGLAHAALKSKGQPHE